MTSVKIPSASEMAAQQTKIMRDIVVRDIKDDMYSARMNSGCRVKIAYEFYDVAVDILKEAGYEHVTEDTPDDSYQRCGFTEDYQNTYSGQDVYFDIWWK